MKTKGIKTKIADFRLKISELVIVGMTGFEPATTRPPDVYSNRAELHPEEQLGLWLSLS